MNADYDALADSNINQTHSSASRQHESSGDKRTKLQQSRPICRYFVTGKGMSSLHYTSVLSLDLSRPVVPVLRCSKAIQLSRGTRFRVPLPLAPPGSGPRYGPAPDLRFYRFLCLAIFLGSARANLEG